MYFNCLLISAKRMVQESGLIGDRDMAELARQECHHEIWGCIWSPGFPEMSICSELPMSAHWAEAKEGGDTHMSSVVGTYIVQQN